MPTTKWYVISEAIADGEAVELHRVRAQRLDDERAADSARAEAEDWARSYSDQANKPTTIDAVWVDENGDAAGAEIGTFYYDPNFPQRDPHRQEGY